jgi:hypothetical protein
MTLLGRSLMLVAPSPGETAAGVAALLALAAPLPYGADFRPYYCIHDPSFRCGLVVQHSCLSWVLISYPQGLARGE